MQMTMDRQCLTAGTHDSLLGWMVAAEGTNLVLVLCDVSLM